MVKSHYDNIPNWETIKKRIFERDNYQCQKCHIKHGTITHQPRYYYPRYAEQLRGGLFLFYLPRIFRKNKFLAATPENILIAFPQFLVSFHISYTHNSHAFL